MSQSHFNPPYHLIKSNGKNTIDNDQSNDAGSVQIDLLDNHIVSQANLSAHELSSHIQALRIIISAVSKKERYMVQVLEPNKPK